MDVVKDMKLDGVRRIQRKGLYEDSEEYKGKTKKRS